jgi:penicillin-binding protein 2
LSLEIRLVIKYNSGKIVAEYRVRLRILIFQIAIVLFFGLFVLQLWRLQVLQGEKYQQLADRNRFRPVQIEASRGIIYDRNGNLLVRNRPTFDIVIIPAFLPDDSTARAKIFTKLSNLLQLPITNGGQRSIASHNAYFRSFLHHEYTRLPNRQVKSSRSRLLDKSPQGIKGAVDNAPPFAPYQPILIAEDVDPDVAAIIEEDRLNLPGVLIQTGSVREYLTGELTSQILGYVGPIPPYKVADYPEPVYGPNDDVGLVGLEARYEDQLHSIKGREIVEVDVTGRKMRTIGDAIPPQPGNNLTLTLDLELQKFVTEALAAAIEESGSQSGAAIVMNPQNGEILAMVSLPTYDNNLFARGISAREFSLLAEDENTPLVNKAITGIYPPASTFKIVIASGALEEGTVTPEQQFFDAGVLYLPNKFFPDDPDLAQPFFCWLEAGHGWVNIISALAFSCNVYFYQVGGGYEPNGYEGLGLDNLVKYAERFGFGSPTGIDLPGEAAGLVPTRKWKRINYAETWVTGDTYNASIGQGFVLATPLQVLNAYVAVGNGGRLYKPYLVKEISNSQKEVVYRAEPKIIRHLNLSPETHELLRTGLNSVVDWGTASTIIDVPGVDVAGKTGTADFCKRYPQCLDRNGRVKDKHAWFVAYAPREDPKVAAIVFVYDGGEGSLTAGPVVNKILRYYFNIDRLVEDEGDSLKVKQITADTSFVPRLLGSDVYPGPFSSISGFVVDRQGEGLAEVKLDLIANGELVAQIATGPTGRFDYNTIDPNLADTWQIQLSDFQMIRPLELIVSPGSRYYLEFQIADTIQDLVTDNGVG